MADSNAIAKFYDAEMRGPRGGWRLPKSIYGREFEGHSESMLVDQIRVWQQNNGTFRSDSEIVDRIWDYFRSREPNRETRAVNRANNFPITAPGVSSDGTSPVSWKSSDGPRLWKEFHDRAAAIVRQAVIDSQLEMRYLSAFTNKIRCPECRSNWNTELSRNPPDVSTPANYFAWTVEIHNAVNDRLGKPQFDLGDARILYNAL